MRIGFDAKRAFLNSSGLGNYSRNTLNALQHYFPNFSYTLFTPKIKKELFTNYEDFDVISPDSPFFKIFKSFWRSFSVSGQLKKNELDLFHGLSNELPDGIHKTHVPSVVTIHDLIFMRYPEFYKPIDRKIYYRKVKYACTAATRVIAISQQTKEDIIQYLNIDESKIDVVYQTISPLYFEKTNATDLGAKYELPEKFILSVGTLEQRKNQLSILKAIHILELDVPVVFVGNPTKYSASLVKFITENKMEQKVKFLNNVPEEDLAGLYQLAELSVYLSKFEGFGLPVIESMACGCPVITSNVSCLPETAGDAAILCNPEDINEIGEKIKMLLENKSIKKEIIQKGIERAKLFHPEKYSRNLISLYTEILS